MSVETLEVYAGRLTLLDAQVRRAIRGEMVATMKDAEGRSTSLARERMHVRTGLLSRSIAGDVTDTAAGYDLHHRAGDAQVKYARIQEEGGTILPKKGRFLAIPTGAALTPSGNPRFPGGPRTAGPLRFIPIRGGAAGLLVRDVPGTKRKGARSEILFRLVRRVNIRSKHYMRDGFDAARAGLGDRLVMRVSALVDGGAGVQ